MFRLDKFWGKYSDHSKTSSLDAQEGKRILKSSLIDDDNVMAFFTTRDLSLKAGEREDMIEEVESNKKLVCEGLDIPFENLIIPQQTHSDNVRVVNCKQETVNRIQFAVYSSQFTDTDALVTNQPKIALALNFADCVPIIFYDPVKKVVAAAHAGWRGTVAKIGPKTVETMVKNFNSNPEDTIALIGPAIGKCCFKVGEDVLNKLKQSIINPSPFSEGLNDSDPTLHPRPLREREVFQCEERALEKRVRGEIYSDAFSDFHADLKLINKLQLLAIGVQKIECCEYCTSCQNELFFSYRKEEGKTARHSAVIMMNCKV